MTKEEIRSKIEREITSGDVHLYIPPPNEIFTSYPILIGVGWKFVGDDNEERFFKMRVDQKPNQELNEEAAIGLFVDSIFEGLSKGIFEIAPVWFRTTEKYAEENKKPTQ